MKQAPEKPPERGRSDATPATDRSSSEMPEKKPRAVQELQRAAGNHALGNLLTSDGSASTPEETLERLGPGRSLDGRAAGRIGRAFGTGFGQVRIHTDGAAAELTRDRRAAALTVGDHIAFAPGAYQPGTPAGDALLAHELAHVVQQGNATPGEIAGGDRTEASLEQDARRATIGAVLSTWGRGVVRHGKRALPVLRAGLRLQACDRGEQPQTSHQALRQAKKDFVSYNTNWSGDLNTAETSRIQDAIEIAAGDNPDLGIAFYTYYGNHEINKFSGNDLAKARNNSAYAETKPHRDTYVDPRILEKTFPSAKLGTLLLHELVHTRHEPGALGSGDFQEGEAYAVEYFLAERSGAEDRVKEINGIIGEHMFGNDQGGYLAGWRRLFRSTYGTLHLLQLKVDGKDLPIGVPEDLQMMSAEQAQGYIAEVVIIKPGARSQTLKSITEWVEENRRALPIPI